MERTQNYSDKWIVEVNSVCSSNVRDHSNWSEYGTSSLCNLYLGHETSGYFTNCAFV